MIVLILVVILLIPLCINSLILCPAIFDFIGEGTDWLLFWGSYLGGAFAALVGFATLHYSAKRQNIEMQISRKESSLRILQAKLSECVSIFNYSRMLTISLYIDQPEKYDQILDELLKYQDEIIASSNAWGVMYANKTNTDYKQAFQDKYEHCIRLFISTITEVQQLIIDLKTTTEKRKINEIINKITQINKDHEKVINDELKPLFQLAQKWIENEELLIQQLQNQL
jgi:hypothetical protein